MKLCPQCGDEIKTAWADKAQLCGRPRCYKRRASAQRIAKGICPQCGKAPVGKNGYRCDPCRLYEGRRTKERQRRERLEAIAAYGGQCACCGESEPKFLCFDHKNNDGAKHRKELFGKERGNQPSMLVAWLKKHGYPKDRFQLLCFNCNCAKAHWKVCPHQS